MPNFKKFPSDEFPKDYKRYHTLLVGASESGKTYYTKYIVQNIKESMVRGGCPADNCPIHVFCGEDSIENWAGSDSSGQLVPAANVYGEWNSDNRNKFITDARSHTNSRYTRGRGLIIFDDCKGLLDFHHDKVFKDWVRTLRNSGCQMIVVGHTHTDVPPLFRDGNIAHILLFHNSNRDAISKLAHAYLNNDKNLLIDLMGQMAKYSVIKINLKNDTIGLHSAPPPDVLGLSTYGLQGDSEDEDGGVGGGGGGVGVGQTSGMGMTGVGSIAGGAVSVNGVYNDASDRSIKLMLNQKQLQSNYQISENRKLLRARLDNEEIIHTHKNKMKLLGMKDELLGMLMQPMLYGEERTRAAGMMGQLMDNNRITADNMFTGYDHDFMQQYFPSVNYVGKDSGVDTLTKYSDLAISGVTGDKRGLVAGLLGHFIAPVSKLVGGKNVPRIKNSYKSAIRKAIVFRTDRHKGRCTGMDARKIRRLLSSEYPVDAHKISGTPIYILIKRFLNEHFPSDMVGESPTFSKLCYNVRSAIVSREGRELGGIKLPDKEKIVNVFSKYTYSVTMDNCVPASIQFLKKYFPYDYADELKILKSFHSEGGVITPPTLN